MTEIELEAAVHQILENAGWGVITQWKLGSKRIDVVATRGDDINSYEIKVHDWRQATRQAFLNLPFFNRSFVIMPSNPRRRVDAGWFEELGIGLLEYSDNGELVEIVEAPRRDMADSLRQAHGMTGPWA